MPGADECVLLLEWHGRTARLVILARQDHHAALFAGPGEVAVAHGVAAAIHSGTLPVPVPHYPVTLAVRETVEHLGPHESAHRPLFGRGGLVDDPERRE